jgi:BON domain
VRAARVAKEVAAPVSRSPREPDAPRHRSAAQPEGDRSTVLVEGEAWSQPAQLGAVPSSRLPARPRSRSDIDNVLHGIGLEIDALLDGLTQPEDPAETAALPVAAEELDVGDRLRALLADNAIDVAELDVAVDGESVMLSGRVGDALSRLLVEDLVWSLPEVHACDNRLAIG